MDKITLHLDFLQPGLNGEDGLMRQHFSSKPKIKLRLKLLFMAQKPRGLKPITSPVKVTYIRYCSRFMDWDNACASFKYIGDALKQAGILSDDSPSIIQIFDPVQVKCKVAEQRTEIIIESICKHI